MSRLSLNISKSLYEQVRALAEKEGVSINDFISMAVIEKVSTLETSDYLKKRAKRGSKEKLLEVLAKAPDLEPEEYDRL